MSGLPHGLRSDVWLCPRCGEENEPESVVCTACDHELRVPSTTDWRDVAADRAYDEATGK